MFKVFYLSTFEINRIYILKYLMIFFIDTPTYSYFDCNKTTSKTQYLEVEIIQTIT